MGLCCSNAVTEEDLTPLILPNGLSTCIVTWNVNAKEPSESFAQLFNHGNIPFDIYVIGLQEVVDLNNAKNLIVDNNANIKWEKAVASALNNPSNERNKRINYTKLRSIGLVGILLMIYIRNDAKFKSLDNIMDAKCASGLFDIAGNKGGVGIRFDIEDTSICFICCHLAAHNHNVKGRNENYHKIIQKLTFVPDEKYEKYEQDAIDSRESSLTHSIEGLSILQHDIVYFLGDMNYRLQFDDLQSVYQLIKHKNWNKLLLKDQLLQQIENGFAFCDFVEGKISFQPTFKYEPGTDEYEHVKKRIPSYCDRILWKIKKNKNSNITDNDDNETVKKNKQTIVNCIRYNCCSDEKMSDHKPVYGLFQIQY